MRLNKCDECGKNIIDGDTYIDDDMFEFTLLCIEPMDIFKKREEHANKNTVVNSYCELYKRREKMEFCSEKCLSDFVAGKKHKNLFDDWEEYKHK